MNQKNTARLYSLKTITYESKTIKQTNWLVCCKYGEGWAFEVWQNRFLKFWALIESLG